MVRDPPRRLLFGERSYGSSGNARPIDLGNGVIVALPSGRSQGAPEAEPLGLSPAAHPLQEPSGSPPSRRSFRPVRWADPADVRAWLNAARTSIADLAALACEGSRRWKHRTLSRAELRRQRRDAERSCRALFDAAEAGLAGLSAEKGASGE